MCGGDMSETILDQVQIFNQQIATARINPGLALYRIQ
jgi:hypothetical protein